MRQHELRLADLQRSDRHAATTRRIACVPHLATITVKPAASTAVSESCRTSSLPCVRLLTTARTSSPSTSSMTAAARMILLETSCSSLSPRAPGRDSDAGGHHRGAHEDRFVQIGAPEQQDAASPSGTERSRRNTRPAVAVPPTLISSDDLTSSPTRKSRNIAPRSDSAVRNSLGRKPAENARADQDSGEDLADDAGLVQPLEQLRHQLGRDEEDQHRERNAAGPLAPRQSRAMREARCHRGARSGERAAPHEQRRNPMPARPRRAALRELISRYPARTAAPTK